MNKLTKMSRRAHARGCHAYLRGSWPIHSTNLRKWDVYVEAESILGPRDLSLTKRQAVALAYRISIAPKQKLVVSLN